MKKILRSWLGIDKIHSSNVLLNKMLENDLKELSSTDLILAGRLKRLKDDFESIIVYLDIERKESYVEDKSFNPPQPKIVKGSWTKRKKK